MTMDQKVIRAKSGAPRTGQAARERQPGLQDNGLWPRQLLSVQGTLRRGGRAIDPVNRSPPERGETAFQELSRRKPLPANGTSPEVEAPGVELSLELPAHGQARIANEPRQRRHALAPAGVRGAWRRNGAETTKKRPEALEARMA